MSMKTGWWVWLILFGLYFATGAQTLTGFGDSDELITAGYTWSIPHPPGFPVLVTLAYIFTHLPLLPPSGGASLLAALVMATTLWTVYDVAVRLVNRPWLAALSTLAAGSSFLIWSHGSHLEVFGLNALFSLLLLRQTLILTLNEQPKQGLPLVLWGVWAGLGFAHHQTFVLTWLPMAVFLGVFLWKQPDKLKNLVKLAGSAVASFFVGYVLLLVLMGWRYHDLSWRFEPTWPGLIAFYFRQDFSGYSVEQGRLSAWFSDISLVKTVEAWKFYGRSLWHHFGLWLVPAGLGLLAGQRKLKKFYWLILAGLVLSGPVLAGYATLPEVAPGSFDDQISRAILERMYLLSEVWLSLFLIVGLILLMEKKTFRVGGLVIPLVMAIWIFQTFPAVNLRAYTVMEKYLNSLIASLPENSLLICFSDITCFGVPYYQQVLGKRQDVILISTPPQHRYGQMQKKALSPLNYPDNPFRLGDMLGRSLADQMPVYLTQLNDVWTQELGLDGQAFWLKPDGYRLQVSSAPDPVLTFKADYIASEILKNNSRWHRHTFVKAQEAMLAEQHVLNGVISARIRQNVWAKKEFSLAQSLNPSHSNLDTLMAGLDEYAGDPRYFGITDGLDRVRAAENCDKQQDLACELQQWQWAVWQSPDDSYRRLQFAAALEKAGILELAKREYKFTLVTDPDNETAAAAMDRLNQVPDLSDWF